MACEWRARVKVPALLRLLLCRRMVDTIRDPPAVLLAFKSIKFPRLRFDFGLLVAPVASEEAWTL